MSTLHLVPDITSEARTTILAGDLGNLTESELAAYVLALCESFGLNPLMRPFSIYRTDDGRTICVANKACCAQLRDLRQISVTKVETLISDGCFIVTTCVEEKKTGRVDQDIGVAVLDGLVQQERADAMAGAVTKSKNRATLSICGLGFLADGEARGVPQTAETVERVDPEYRATVGEPPKQDSAAGVLASPAPRVPAATAAEPAFSKPRRQTAATVLPEGGPVTVSQLATILELRREASGPFAGDDERETWTRVIRIYRDPTGGRCGVTAQLAVSQADHLIARLRRHIARGANKAERRGPPDIGALDVALERAPEELQQAIDNAANSERLEDRVKDCFQVAHISELGSVRAREALQMLMTGAFGQ